MTTPTPGQKPRPWYAKKRHMLWYVPILAFVALMVLAVNSPPPEPEPVEPARSADVQAADTDAEMGEIGITEEPAPEPEPEPAAEPEPEPAPEPEAEPAETAGQENARQTAEDYLDYSPFSKSGLIEQLEYEGYDTADAEYAVDNVEVNWRDQAALQAESYLEYDSFSRSGLIEQLEYEGFTTKQATYGVDQVGL